MGHSIKGTFEPLSESKSRQEIKVTQCVSHHVHNKTLPLHSLLHLPRMLLHQIFAHQPFSYSDINLNATSLEKPFLIKSRLSGTLDFFTLISSEQHSYLVFSSIILFSSLYP